MGKFICGGFIWVLACTLILQGCSQSKGSADEEKDRDSLAIRKAFSSSPVLTPEESIKQFHLEEGFTIKLVAAEPLVIAPVALTFDDIGRMWVIEMQGYMPDTAGTGEDKPLGKIVILEDTNKDGIADTRKVAIDALVMPRAICLIEDGILVAEPPKLWFYTLKNDRPVKKDLIDSSYAEGGNVEHQPNGLLRALDNWIYSANSEKRYRKKGSRWFIERTFGRGQWGISQDDHGRLFYNNNSENLLGDYFTPGLGASNVNQRRVSGFDEKIIPDNRVFPSRPNTGVNRGYMQGILDDSLRLVNFTAASGPVIYRGGIFGSAYNGNAFVGEPSANLIKRNILEENGYKVSGKQAYKGKEFLSSTDERFRPVTLYNGPDGALYVIDLYRGIIQHKTYLTQYLKNEIKLRELTKPLGYGRIYKIVPANYPIRVVSMPSEADELLKLLEHSNGWVRDKAQQMMVDQKPVNIIPALRQRLQQADHPLLVIHCLWTLEGLGALESRDVLPLLKQSSWLLRRQALSILPSVLSKATYKQFIPLLNQMVMDNDTLAAPYIGFTANAIQLYDKPAANRLLMSVIKRYPANVYVADAVISNLKDHEAAFIKALLASGADTSMVIFKRLQKVLEDIRNANNNRNAKILEMELPKGTALFKSTCQTCHGADGNGIKSLAPPLNNSDWVRGDKNKLIPIVLYGLTGPIQVSGISYEAPEISGDMPGIGYNKELSDEDIAQVINFIRNSWNNDAGKVSADDIRQVRQRHNGRQKAFTMEELKRLK